MKQHFYSEIVNIESLKIELRAYALDPEEHEELMSLAEEMVHHAILDMILSELSEEDKKTFLLYIIEEPGERIWEHLLPRIDDLHAKIRNTVAEIEAMLIEDLHEKIAS